MQLSNEKQRLAIVCALLLWCGALIFYRLYLAEDLLAIGLLWNLFLACIPLFCSVGFAEKMARRQFVLATFYFVFWLLFLPNAPYILTDLIHLSPRPNVPLWFMLAMILSCAGTGTLLGYLSLINVQNVVQKRFGAAVSWALAVWSLMLCGFGIYVGRFLRWNSWDALTRPVQLARSVLGQFLEPGPHPHPVAVTLVYGIGLLLGYLALRAVSSTMQNETDK